MNWKINPPVLPDDLLARMGNPECVFEPNIKPKIWTAVFVFCFLVFWLILILISLYLIYEWNFLYNTILVFILLIIVFNIIFIYLFKYTFFVIVLTKGVAIRYKWKWQCIEWNEVSSIVVDPLDDTFKSFKSFCIIFNCDNQIEIKKDDIKNFSKLIEFIKTKMASLLDHDAGDSLLKKRIVVFFKKKPPLKFLEDYGPVENEYFPEAGETTRYFLKWINGPLSGKICELSKSNIIIGRSPDCDIVIPITSIARNHAHLIRTNDEYLIKDLDTRSGFFVNGCQVCRDQVKLNNGDLLQFCEIELLYRQIDKAVESVGRIG